MRMVQTVIFLKGNMTEESLHQMLYERFSSIDVNQARNDVLPFIKNPETVNLWSEDFFTSITRDRLKVE